MCLLQHIVLQDYLLVKNCESNLKVVINLKVSMKLNLKFRSSVLLGDYDTEQNPDCDENDDTNCADPVQNVVVESSIFHPNFDPLKSINDIGIIRLAESAKLTQNNIKTICLPFDDNAKRITGKYEVIGWGATENSTFHKILQKANLPPYDLQKCEEKLGLFVKNQHDRKKLIDGQICAGGEKSIDACHGKNKFYILIFKYKSRISFT